MGTTRCWDWPTEGRHYLIWPLQAISGRIPVEANLSNCDTNILSSKSASSTLIDLEIFTLRIWQKRARMTPTKKGQRATIKHPYRLFNFSGPELWWLPLGGCQGSWSHFRLIFFLEAGVKSSGLSCPYPFCLSRPPGPQIILQNTSALTPFYQGIRHRESIHKCSVWRLKLTRKPDSVK
jgi:hypothetical protein